MRVFGQIIIVPVRGFGNDFGGTHGGFFLELAYRGNGGIFARINAALRHLPPMANAIVILFLKAPSNPHEALGVEQHNTHARPVGRNQFCITH